MHLSGREFNRPEAHRQKNDTNLAVFIGYTWTKAYEREIRSTAGGARISSRGRASIFHLRELDRLVGGLPSSARVHRPWSGNTLSHNRPHAMSWMAAGRRVMGLRMGETVVFSPADARTEVANLDRPVRLNQASTPVLDGVVALSSTLARGVQEHP